MHSSKTFLLCSSILAASLALQTAAQAHGFAGDRFFPATIETDDPFVADEGSLPTIDEVTTPQGRQRDLESDISLTLTPNFGIGAAETFTKIAPFGGKTVTGFDNVDLSAMYQFYENDQHESILSLGVVADVGGSGRPLIGANSYTTWTPSLNFGKGLGDLPDSLGWIRPFAITGVLGLALPTEASTQGVGNPHVYQMGFAVEYNLIYLQGQVKNIGLVAPFDRMIPLVEFQINDPLDRGQAGQINAYAYPGVIWSGRYYQIGAEAIVPMNSRTGSSVGLIVQLHFYLDDLFPKSLGRPLLSGLFGDNK